MNYPHAYFSDYVNDLEPASVRLLSPCNMKYRIPDHETNMKERFNIRNDEMPEFILTQ